MLPIVITYLLFLAIPSSTQIQTVGPMSKADCAEMKDTLKGAFKKLEAVCAPVDNGQPAPIQQPAPAEQKP